MSENKIKEMIAGTFLEIADALETGTFGKQPVIGGADASAAPAVMPAKEVVTYEIHGIEVIDLDDAAASLWAKGIYAETGMGCTGPVILVSEANGEKARDVLKASDYIV